jgi:hypothetical protein
LDLLAVTWVRKAPRMGHSEQITAQEEVEGAKYLLAEKALSISG